MISLALQTRHPVTGERLQLSTRSGEITVICGRSGRGKSTILGQIWGSRPLETGATLTLSIDGQSHDLGAWSPATLAHLRPRLMCHVEQNPMVLKRDLLSSWFRPHDPLLAQGMAAFDLDPDLLARRAGEVSGGERQRFILLQAILSDCPIVLLDEPFSGLDPDRKSRVAALLTRVANEGRLVVFSDHEDHAFAQKTLQLG